MQMSDRYMNPLSTPLITKGNADQKHRETPPHTWQYQKRRKATSVGEDVGERGPLYAVSGNESRCSHYGQQCGDLSKPLKIETPYDLAIPLLDIYLKKMKTLIWKDHDPQCLLQPYIQQPNHGNNLCVHQWTKAQSNNRNHRLDLMKIENFSVLSVTIKNVQR